MELKSNGPILKTLLVSDLVASTCLVERLGDKRAALLFARHDRLARDLLARHGGFEIDKADGFLLLFERPLAAVRYALEYHQALAHLAADLDDLAPEANLMETLSARIGIHLGEIFLRRNPADDVARGAKPIEVEGLAKPIASRLMSLAASHQTLLTRGAFELARRAAVDMTASKSTVCWLCHGAYRIQGVERPIRIYEVGMEGIAPLAPPEGSEKIHPSLGEETLPWRWISPGAVAEPSASREGEDATAVLSCPPAAGEGSAALGHEERREAPQWLELARAMGVGGQELIARIAASVSAESERRLARERARGRLRLIWAMVAAAFVTAAGLGFQEYRIAVETDRTERETQRANRAEAASQQLSQMLANLVAAKEGEARGVLLRGGQRGDRYDGPLAGRPLAGPPERGADDMLILLPSPDACSPELALPKSELH